MVGKITGNLIVVDGTTLEVREDGKIVDKTAGRPITLGDVRIGDRVQGATTGNGQPAVVDVLHVYPLNRDGFPSQEVTGVVSSRTGNSLTVDGLEMLIAPRTVAFLEASGASFDPRKVEPGDSVLVTSITIKGTAYAGAILILP